MGEVVDLVLDRRDDLRVPVAGIQDRDSAGEVDIAVALLVPDFRILGAVGIDLGHHAHAARHRGLAAGFNLGILHGRSPRILRTASCRRLAPTAPGESEGLGAKI